MVWGFCFYFLESMETTKNTKYLKDGEFRLVLGLNNRSTLSSICLPISVLILRCFNLFVTPICLHLDLKTRQHLEDTMTLLRHCHILRSHTYTCTHTSQGWNNFSISNLQLLFLEENLNKIYFEVCEEAACSYSPMILVTSQEKQVPVHKGL